ncbi:MAG TPA: flagellar basal-body rod protein FlgF [Phycisphaerae bacterium]|jgi:flagellar basal-body rod protein FlgG|nr:flagellar basal-body rod protein FlgF [Phycisphaerae bacterium]HOB75280.1 flagellar basal-body rod protein FlgF [Phycisphaerae bacterium]HOJ55044.1 flagellar basal-body rod protein FlgF [Phycisphaerae bacterium]HOL27785.1 flagellar basal-body rod protein FlgF [Phycisphaerae bacterium]HPP21994.1 flagellar basal-body rod protein FlgF [Phycisphaerae bacterium]
MVYGIYSSAAGLLANQYRQEVLANNLANVNTAGFKQDLTVIRERQPASRENLVDPEWSDHTLAGLTGHVLVAPTTTSFESGTLETTGKPLDVAIAGEGFFRVRAGGMDRYTRDGRFTLSPDGTLVTAAGNAEVLDETGRPIHVPRNLQGQVRIDANGEVRAGNRSFGRVGVVEFDDRSLLRKTGGNLLESLGARARSVEPTLHSGAIEGSNVDPTRTMVSMIEVTRAYQMNATLVGLADQTLGRAVNDIARVK